MGLRIARLTAENYKRLKAVEITPAGNVVTLSGRNAQGKTSVLDAIWAALAGAEASRATKRPIRDGEQSAVVTLDLGEYIVTRRWTHDGPGTLTIESPDGARYSSPQKLLDEMVGARAFDPLAFTRMSARDQVAALISTVEIGFDPAELERERKGIFDRRTEVSRDVKRLEAQLSGMPTPDPSLPDVEVSTADVLAEEDAARAQNARIDAAIDELARRESTREQAEARLREAKRALVLAEDDLETARDLVAQQRAVLAEMPERIDTDEIRARLQSVEETNAKVRAQQHARQVAANLAEWEEDAAALTGKLLEIERRKADALAAVEFPVPGLSFDETGVTFNGVPLAQASAAEQLRVSVALAMAANPTLRVLQVRDGSLLDAESLRIIEDLAAERDYQLWLEVVTDSEGVGIVLEDGQVRA